MSGSANFIVFSIQPWDLNLGSNCRNIAKEFSRNHKVLYINSPLDVNTFLKSRGGFVGKRLDVIGGKAPEIEQVGDNIWVLTPRTLLLSINWMPKSLFSSFNFFNNRLLSARIRSVIKKLGFNKPVLFNDSDMFRAFHMPELLDVQGSYYYSRDNLLGVRFWQRHGVYKEPQLVKKSTACFANSEYLTQLLARHNPESYFVGQGCDLSDFDPGREYSRPPELPAGKPIIGYTGALTSLRLDLDLINSLATGCPDMNIVLVGPEDEHFQRSNLHRLNNVHFIPTKKPEELPAYISFFDVCINPQLVNEVTKGNYPRKIDEYLAMGKPVVAVKTEAMNLFREHVALASGYEDFTAAVKKAAAANDLTQKQARIAFARSHTWENSVSQMYRVMEKTIAL